MVPAAVVVEAADELDSIGVAEFGGMEEHDIALIDRDGMQAIGPAGLLRKTRCRAGDIQAFGVVVLIGDGGIIAERVMIMEKCAADRHGLRLRRRINFFVSTRARSKRACNYNKEKRCSHMTLMYCKCASILRISKKNRTFAPAKVFQGLRPK